MLKALITLNDFSAGTLWLVANRLWKKHFTNFDLKHPDGYHPGLSFGCNNLTSIYQPIPISLGSHANHCGFKIKGVMESTREETTFFQVRPKFISLKERFGAIPGLMPNSFKLKLNDKEQKSFISYLKNKGISFNE